MLGVTTTQSADLMRAAASIVWALAGISVVVVIRRALADGGPIRKLGFGPSGVTMEFAEAKLTEAVQDAGTEMQSKVGPAARRAVAVRLDRSADVLRGARVLWADDHPEHNDAIRQLLERYGVTVDAVLDNAAGIARISATRFDAVISDVGRDNEGPGSDLKGLDLAEEVFRKTGQRTILFTERFNPATLPGLDPESRLREVERVRMYVFGTTNRTDELIHLLLDQLNR